MWPTKFVELGVACIGAAELDDAFAHVGGKFIAQRAARHADDGELFGQQIGLKEMKERGEQLALGEVAGGAEDDENAGLGDALAAFGNLGKILGAHGHLHGGHGWIHLRRWKKLLARSAAQLLSSSMRERGPSTASAKLS